MEVVPAMFTDSAFKRCLTGLPGEFNEPGQDSQKLNELQPKLENAFKRGLTGLTAEFNDPGQDTKKLDEPQPKPENDARTQSHDHDKTNIKHPLPSRSQDMAHQKCTCGLSLGSDRHLRGCRLLTAKVCEEVQDMAHQKCTCGLSFGSDRHLRGCRLLYDFGTQELPVADFVVVNTYDFGTDQKLPDHMDQSCVYYQDDDGDDDNDDHDDDDDDDDGKLQGDASLNSGDGSDNFWMVIASEFPKETKEKAKRARSPAQSDE